MISGADIINIRRARWRVYRADVYFVCGEAIYIYIYALNIICDTIYVYYVWNCRITNGSHTDRSHADGHHPDSSHTDNSHTAKFHD